MSDRMTCPGCQTHTSSVLARYLEDEPCPYCGLPASAAAEVMAAQKRNADAELTRKYTEVVTRLGHAEAETAKLRSALQQIGWILDELPKDAPERARDDLRRKP